MKIAFPRFKVRDLMMLTALVALALGGILWLEAQQRRHRESRGHQAECQSSLNNIQFALWAYCQNFAHFPPPFLADEQGKRTQSWRVTFVRYCGVDDMSVYYDLDSPWDSASNRSLTKARPPWLNCPAYRTLQPPLHTPFLMINDLSQYDLKDIPKNAILVIEAENLHRDWRNPFDELSEAQLHSLKSTHPNGFGIILADYTRLRLRDTSGIKKEGGLFVLDPRMIPVSK